MDAHQCRSVVRHDGHPRLDDRAAMAFVGEVPCSPTQQAGHEAFDHGSAVSTCVRKVYLGRGPDVVQVRFVQAPEDVLWRGRRGQRIDRSRDSHRENPPFMQRLPRGHAEEKSLALYRDLALADVSTEYEAAMQSFPVR
jgi:hypothetical protein